MLRIRREQYEALVQYSSQRFEEQAFQHLQECWPRQCKALGPEAVRASISDGITRAARYGLNGKREIVTFLDAMYVLGFGFDTDASRSWAAEILAARVPPSVKTRRLWERTKQSLQAGRHQEERHA